MNTLKCIQERPLKEYFKTCILLICVISFTALVLIGVTLLIEGKIAEDKQSYETLVHTSKN